MFTAILITLLPTLLTSILLPKAGLKPKSGFLAITFYWLSGLFFFTIATFFVAVLYNNFTTEVLLKATYAVLLVVQVFLLLLIKDVHHSLALAKHIFKPLDRKHLLSIFLVAFCFIFAYIFFAHNLKIVDQTLYTTNIYWDFHWHAALINNFAFGDNFPPENEAFSGLPHTYHYFWGVVAAIYEVVGLNLADAINCISILAFGFLLLGLIGLGEELFHSRIVGVLAVILTLTSSSLHFVNYFADRSHENVGQILSGILFTTQHPWYASFLSANAYGYNGTMLNLFYFLEERQLIFGVVYLILCVWLLSKREELSNKVLFFVGAAMGGFFLWHLFITISVLCAILFLLVFAKEKQKTFMLLAGFGVIFGAHYIYFKEVMRSEWFDKSITGYPRLDFDFASGEHEPFSWHDVFVYYIYSYGTKLIFIVFSLFFLFKKNKRIFLLITAILLPTFILVNAVQLSPSSIYENHKWFRPMNVIMDLAVAYILFKLFFEDRTKLKKTFGFMWLFFLTISGIIELTPFLNAQPSDAYAAYPSSITKAVSEKSPPRSSFTGTDINEINLAGRKVFLGNNLGGDMAFKKDKRKQIIEDIYRTTNLTNFCDVTQQYKIDFVEFDKDSYSPLKELALAFPHFNAVNATNEPVYFVDVKKSCRQP
jgi:hypothetical protein